MEEVGLLLQLLRGAVVADPAALEDLRPVGQAQRDVGELLDQQDADPDAATAARVGTRRLTHDGRQAQRELVDEEDRRAARPAPARAPPSAARRPRASGPWRPSGAAARGTARARTRAGLGLRLAERSTWRPAGCRPPRARAAAGALGDDGDAGRPDLLGPAPGELLVTEQDRPRRRPQHAGHREHQRGLPGAVRAEQGRHLAGRDLQRHVVQDETVPARDVERVDDAGARRRAQGRWRSQLLLGAQVGLDHVLVPQDLGRAPRTRSAGRSRAPRGSRSRPTPGSCRGPRGSPARRSPPGCA